MIVLPKSFPPSAVPYKNLGKSDPIVRRLQNEMAQAVILGESQRQIIKRIQKVTGQSANQVRTIAQTERTRIQSQARAEAMDEAASYGVKLEDEWSARMVNTRESHADLHGKRVPHGEGFHTVWGNTLRFPGDPQAPAREVIRCHCVLIPRVLLPGERQQSQSQNPVLKRPFENGKMNTGDRFSHAGKTVTFLSWDGNAKTIAGKGCKRKIDIVDHLVSEYGGSSKEWKKKKRWAKIEIDGSEYYADIHWFEEQTVGIADGKVKHDEYGYWYYSEGEMYSE